jgi:hypothetical protein
MESSNPGVLSTSLSKEDVKKLNPIIMRDYYDEP